MWEEREDIEEDLCLIKMDVRDVLGQFYALHKCSLFLPRKSLWFNRNNPSRHDVAAHSMICRTFKLQSKVCTLYFREKSLYYRKPKIHYSKSVQHADFVTRWHHEIKHSLGRKTGISLFLVWHDMTWPSSPSLNNPKPDTFHANSKLDRLRDTGTYCNRLRTCTHIIPYIFRQTFAASCDGIKKSMSERKERPKRIFAASPSHAAIMRMLEEPSLSRCVLSQQFFFLWYRD